MNGKKVFVYTRVSTREQTDGGGFDRQMDACINLAENRGWIIEREYREQQSGADDVYDRPMLSEAIRACGKSSGVGIILLERLDRVARSLIVSEMFFRECRIHNIEVYTADSREEQVNAKGDPTRTLIRQVFGALAEWNKMEIQHKLLAGRKRKARLTGKQCGGPTVYGRRTPAERDVMEQVVFLKQSEGKTFSEIALTLEGQGIPNPRGGSQWSATTLCRVYRRFLNNV